MYSEDLLNGIIRYVPLARARVLLYKNGEINSSLCALEVEMHKRSMEKPAVYVGYYQYGQGVIETFSDVQEAEKRVAVLKEADNTEPSLEAVVVNGEKKL